MGKIAAVIDTETTGFRPDKGHRLVEFSASLYDLATRQKLRNYTIQINPLRDIPADASKVHGIYLEDLHDAPTWEKVAPFVSKLLHKTDLMVAHNLAFDAHFIGEELIRVGQPVPNIATFCTMENGRWATGTGKSPKLAELCWALNVDYDPAKAHRAEYDVDCTAAALFAGLDQGYFTLPISL